MSEVLTAVLLVLGALFTLLASVGLVRMPDLFTRMHPATKATTLGAAFLLVSVAAHFREIGVSSRAVATMLFFVLTQPIAAHLIARAAYAVGVPLWEGTIDEHRGGATESSEGR